MGHVGGVVDQFGHTHHGELVIGLYLWFYLAFGLDDVPLHLFLLPLDFLLPDSLPFLLVLILLL